MNIKKLYEDDDILAIEKPSGISMHQDGRKSEDFTIADWFSEQYPASINVGEPFVFNGEEIKRPGIVHRLDKDTSGVLLLVKSQEAHQFLKKQFQNTEIKKTYIAIVFGHIKKDAGVIEEPIGRSPSDFRRRLAGRGAKGELREATTEYVVLERGTSKDGEKFSIIEAHPKTGRTHQIRVHMKFLSYPVLCDKLYAPKNFCPTKIGRLALHAKSIEFKNLKGEAIKVESSLPEEFTNF
ncbi:MAG: RluA family pseudouridine synthase [Candidatus Pacebacteria bacterium]|nr:RluA family pseudouridine synthase [Candidatus Paceibacterota bacterium]MCF7862449.1 RluA family pseudouridine synthase [Candidatus Paceibacterota bacterium]